MVGVKGEANLRAVVLYRSVNDGPWSMSLVKFETLKMFLKIILDMMLYTYMYVGLFKLHG